MKVNSKVCKHEGCSDLSGVPGTAKGLCVVHYNEYRRSRPHKQCLVEDCELSAKLPGSGRGYCSKHLYRVRKHGSPTEGGRLPNGMSLAERIAKKYEVQPGTGCFVWTDKPNPDGYGLLMYDGRAQGAHRLAWVLVNGNIPEGLVIDHLCENRLCVNTAHMEVVTRAENASRGWYRPDNKKIPGVTYTPRQNAG